MWYGVVIACALSFNPMTDKAYCDYSLTEVSKVKTYTSFPVLDFATQDECVTNTKYFIKKIKKVLVAKKLQHLAVRGVCTDTPIKSRQQLVDIGKDVLFKR